MCFVVTCSECGKSTWSGCGRHIQQVLSSIDLEDRCSCGSTDQQAPGLHRALMNRIVSGSELDNRDDDIGDDEEIVTQIDSEMFISPFVSSSDFDALHRLGIRTLIQIRQPANEQSNRPAEPLLREDTMAAGLDYAECLWNDELVLQKQAAASEQLADQLLSVIDRVDKPVVLVSGSMMLEGLAQAHRTTRKGVPLPLQSGTAGGVAGASLPLAMQDFLHDYIQRKTRRAMSRPGLQEILEGQVWISSQPTEQELVKAQKMGIRTVINLRDPLSEAGNLGMGVLPREAGIVKSLGMVYVNLPTKQGQTPTAAQVQAIIEEIDRCEKPCLVHCRYLLFYGGGGEITLVS